jgi:hypothetical protein
MKFRFFFDPRSGVCLWAADDQARNTYGYPIALEELPISQSTKDFGNRLLQQFDTSIDGHNPGGPSLWADSKFIQFKEAANELFKSISTELGNAFELRNEVGT